MRPTDVRNIIRFNTRMGMYICPCERSNVVSFLAGYEYAAAGECDFTEALGNHLTKRHRIKRNALGWSHQVACLAERRSLEWMETYLLVSSELLSTAAESEDATSSG